MRRAVGYQAATAGPAKPNPSATNDGQNHLEQLAGVVRQRIDSRLPGRVRNLKVSVQSDTLLLEGTCSTYYTKQLAQHAALGILEDEHLENAIVVSIGR